MRILRLPIGIALLGAASARLITFSNIAPRRDTGGNIINAHDGTTRRYAPGGRFYYAAMGYPACNETGKINGCTDCIYGVSNSVAVWSSPDLSSGSWKREVDVYPGDAGFPQCTYFRSQAVYNSATQQHVLWMNVAGCADGVCPASGCPSYATATAPSPTGPYTFRGWAHPGNLTIVNSTGDFALFVDDDGSAYNIVTHGIAGAGHRDMYIYALTTDYLSFAASRTPALPGPHLVEAPAMFKRGATYYALLGGCTCMGLYGGGVAVLTAPAPLGPWTNITDALDPGCRMEAQSTCFQMGPGVICNPVTQVRGSLGSIGVAIEAGAR